MLSAVHQGQLTLHAPDHVGGVKNLSAAFRRLYYHLYSNSNASRAERIIDDLSLVLLLKLALEDGNESGILGTFLSGKKTAKQLLIPFLQHRFPELVQPQHRFHLDDKEIRLALHELADVNLSKSPAHVLGEAFQALIGPQLRGEKGQFFTPRSLVSAMVKIVDPQPYESIVDPACGTGGFLMEAHAHQSRKAPEEKLTGILLGVDKDADLARLASTLLKVATKGRTTIQNTNSLEIGYWKSRWDQFDVVLTNPPFGSKIGIKDKTILARYAFGHQWVRNKIGGWFETEGILGSQDPQVLFLELCIRLLKPGGRMGIVLPEGLFGNRSQSYIWDWIRNQGEIVALIDCPRTTFQPGTDTKTNVLVFRKNLNKNPEENHRVTRIGVVLNCGHDRRGRTHFPDGTPYPNDFERLSAAYSDGVDRGDMWTAAELGTNEYVVPRYYVKGAPASEEEHKLVLGAAICTLGQLIEQGVIGIRKGHEVGGVAYGTGDIPFVRTSDLSNFEIRTDPTRSVSHEVYEKYRMQQDLSAGDILMVIDGRYRIGTTAILTGNNHRCVVQSHIGIIKAYEPRFLSSYELLFALNLPFVKMRIRSLVFVQSTLGTLGKRLLELEIPMLGREGPWSSRVSEFQSILEKRDRLLAKLNLSGRDVDL